MQDVGEVACPVAGPVVGDDPLDSVDAMGGEPRPGAVHESNGRDSLFIAESFGIGQP